MTAQDLIPKNKEASLSAPFFSGLFGIWGKLSREPLGLYGFVVLFVLIILAVFAPWIAPYDPMVQNLQAAFLPPSLQYLAGTDEFGRDIFSRLVFSAQITIATITAVMLIVGPIGLIIWVISCFVGGRTDTFLMRITDIVLSFPSLILALAFAAALGAGLETAIVAISVTSWPPIVRLARSEAHIVRHTDYVAAAKLYGASPLLLLMLYIAPMCIPLVIVRLTLNMAGIILTAASLGFLGLGAQPPAPEWGAIISSGRKFILDHWWVAVMPEIAILVTSLVFNLIGDTLCDLLDPRHGHS